MQTHCVSVGFISEAVFCDLKGETMKTYGAFICAFVQFKKWFHVCLHYKLGSQRI